MDRRALFFLGAAIVPAILIPVSEADYRWVPIFLTVVYMLLALASWADRRTPGGSRRRRGASLDPDHRPAEVAGRRDLIVLDAIEPVADAAGDGRAADVRLVAVDLDTVDVREVERGVGERPRRGR